MGYGNKVLVEPSQQASLDGRKLAQPASHYTKSKEVLFIMKQSNHHVVRIDGHRIAYNQEGEDRPVLLIHGILTPNLFWRTIMPELASTHRVFAPDLLNYGKSDKPADANVSIEAQNRLIVKFMDQLGLKSADIVAHAIGGGVAQLIAVNHPERVRKLVLIDAVCFDSWPIPEFLPLQKAGVGVSMSLAALFENDARVHAARRSQQGRHDGRPHRPLSGALVDRGGKESLVPQCSAVESRVQAGDCCELKHLPHQTLILWAEHDVFQKPTYALELKQTIPHAELIWIKDAGHWLMEEKPEEISGHLSTFLGRQ